MDVGITYGPRLLCINVCDCETSFEIDEGKSRNSLKLASLYDFVN